MRGLSLVAASGGHSSSRCAGLSLSRPLLLRSTSSRRAGSVVVAHGSSCSAACGIFPDQGLNLCPLHWQADSQLLRHQGSPLPFLLTPVCKNCLSPEEPLKRPRLGCLYFSIRLRSFSFLFHPTVSATITPELDDFCLLCLQFCPTQISFISSQPFI